MDTKPDDIPQEVIEIAQAVQDEAEAECIKERFVYGFGTGNAKTVLDMHIARAILKAKNEALESAAEIADKGHFIAVTKPGVMNSDSEAKWVGLSGPEIAQAIRNLKHKG